MFLLFASLPFVHSDESQACAETEPLSLVYETNRSENSTVTLLTVIDSFEMNENLSSYVACQTKTICYRICRFINHFNNTFMFYSYSNIQYFWIRKEAIKGGLISAAVFHTTLFASSNIVCSVIVTCSLNT